MQDIEQNIKKVYDRIRLAELKYHRPPNSVKLIAVSKTKPEAAILAATRAGQCAFGENYVQEAISKIENIRNPSLEWHFLGPIQSNKTRLIVANFSWVHSVDRLKIAQRLSEQRKEALPALNVCLQVNISQEARKSGVSVKDVPSLVEAISVLPRLKLRGFMVIPRKSSDLSAQRKPFAEVRQLKETIAQQCGIKLDTLSMGMSSDLEAAVAEGASHVRIGTDIFGSRN
ncbi:MAG TPA: YggS family pyridoxal phosphate-dependent enzyme [Gammaproteobacteria bacterium]|nr:YggS family pyridoxal phosphate-dependent enzyme [Gammaproteobacteria bacterium]